MEAPAGRPGQTWLELIVRKPPVIGLYKAAGDRHGGALSDADAPLYRAVNALIETRDGIAQRGAAA